MSFLRTLLMFVFVFSLVGMSGSYAGKIKNCTNCGNTENSNENIQTKSNNETLINFYKYWPDISKLPACPKNQNEFKHKCFGKFIWKSPSSNPFIKSLGGLSPGFEYIGEWKNNLPHGHGILNMSRKYEVRQKYYKPTEFSEGRKKMAMMPVTAKLILNPTSGAPGFYVENVFSLPGVPSILKSMLGGLDHLITGGAPILSHTINLRTVESEIAKSLTQVQNNNQDVEIGSYPFFRAGKLGVSIVVRSTDKAKIDTCNNEILRFVMEQKIQIVNEV